MRKKIVRLAIIVAILTALFVCIGVIVAGSLDAKAEAGKEPKLQTENKTDSERGKKGKEEKSTSKVAEKQDVQKNEAKPKQKKKHDNSKSSSKRGAYQNTASEKGTSLKPNASTTYTEKAESITSHRHDWQAIYETVNREVYGAKCNNCGFGTKIAAELYNHIDASPFDECGSYSTGVVIGYETEKTLIGYKCYCGMSK